MEDIAEMNMAQLQAEISLNETKMASLGEEIDFAICTDHKTEKQERQLSDSIDLFSLHEARALQLYRAHYQLIIESN